MKGRDGQVSASSQSRQKRPRTKVILSPDFPLALCPLELNSRQAPISIVQGTCHCSLTREECFSKEARTDLPSCCSLPSPHSCWNKQKAVPTVQLELQVGCPSYDPSKHGHCQAGRVSPPGGAKSLAEKKLHPPLSPLGAVGYWGGNATWKGLIVLDPGNSKRWSPSGSQSEVPRWTDCYRCGSSGSTSDLNGKLGGRGPAICGLTWSSRWSGRPPQSETVCPGNS